MDRLDQLPGGAPESLTQQRADVVVFACGDPAHADHDSIAITACKGLPADVLARIDLKITGPMRPEYLRDLSAGTFVIVADTVPGASAEMVEVPFIELVGREAPLMASSTPDQPLDEVVAVADLLREEPLRGRFVGLSAVAIDLRHEADEAEVKRLREAVVAVIAALEP